MLAVSSASAPNVALARAHRGSLARSICGWSATRMPTARYSSRTVRANRSTSSTSPMAARPVGSGNCVNGPAMSAAAGLLLKECRGSLEIVNGMPSGCRRTSSWTALFHSAISRAEAAIRMLAWLMRLLNRVRIDGMPRKPGSSNLPMLPSGWKSRPALSSSSMRASRSSTRCSTLREGSW